MELIELHVWNRAFGLPSLDPECLAAIAFLSAAIPQHLWVLVESNNIAISPNGALPALKSGSEWIGGFDSIVSYLNLKTSRRSDIDGSLSEIQNAQVIAYRSFIRKTCLPIISLSLYITSKNWTTVTRPLYSTFVQFPIQYEIPHTHHARAVSLTSHLTSLIRDIAVEETRPAQPVSTTFAGITTTNADNKTQAEKEKITTRVKLRNFLADFLDPIREKMGGGDTFFGAGSLPTTIDCLLVGYLSLLVYPILPSPWAKEILEQEFPDVISYVENFRASMFPPTLAYRDPGESDKLTFTSWVRNGVDGIPGRWGWDNGIPLEEEDCKHRSSSFWLAVQGLLGVATMAGSVFVYKALTAAEIEVDVVEKVGDAEVYTVARAEAGDVSATGATYLGDNEAFREEEGRSEPLPIFKAEDMLGLKF
ncbi:Metaxin-1 [Dactylellina cionopaga]|nr:Metaxin-1 [Dactylellina cionopaga]